MGCCISKDSGGRDAPQCGGGTNGRRENSTHLGANNSSNSHNGHPGNEPGMQLHDRFNLPLRRHLWKSQTPMTSTELRRQREEYFDTRVSGRAEMWSALRMAVEEVDAELETAQQILTASGINVPTGTLPPPTLRHVFLTMLLWWLS